MGEKKIAHGRQYRLSVGAAAEIGDKITRTSKSRMGNMTELDYAYRQPLESHGEVHPWL